MDFVVETNDIYLIDMLLDEFSSSKTQTLKVTAFTLIILLKIKPVLDKNVNNCFKLFERVGFDYTYQLSGFWINFK